MNSYMVLYRIESEMSPSDAPFGFRCYAEDVDHAEEQCTDAYPDCDIVWVANTDDYEEALAQYYWLESEVRA